VSLDPAQRAGLERARAIALAREYFGIDETPANVDTVPFGVVVRLERRACVVISSRDLGVLGGVLVWAARHDVSDIDLVFEHNAGTHARRCESLAPHFRVWTLAGSSVVRAAPEVRPNPHRVTPEATALVAMIERCGADVVVEDGIIRAEIAGLEVGRVVEGPTGPLFEVGVGRFDREAAALLNEGQPTELALLKVIERVRTHRVVGVHSHAVNRIARERWIRSLVARDLTLAGLDVSTVVMPVEPIPPRLGLLDATPAALVTSGSGQPLMIVCSTGMDLGLVPAVADLVAEHEPSEVRFVMPRREVLPYLRQLVDRLPLPTSIIGIDPPWVD
jgi:hypothetical protein